MRKDGAMKDELNLEDVLKATSGELISHHPAYRAWQGVGTDTRQDLSGLLFVALRGEHFDAHNFLQGALEKGATGLLVDQITADLQQRINAKSSPALTVVKVQDTLRALQSLAHYWRRKNKAKIVAITGSSGKTTTKEFTASILQSHLKTHFNRGSFNNHWGVPMTLLALRSDHEVGVIEMGMNHSGEITDLCRIAEPDITLVVNVGQGHIGELGSQEAVVQAKWEIYRSSLESVQIFNLDNQHTQRMYQEAKIRGHQKILTFGKGGDVELRVTQAGIDFIEVSGHIGSQSGRARIPVFGQQNVENVMAAAAIALSLELNPGDLWQSLESLHTIWGRNQLVKLPSGTRVMFDAYNANPESMAALLRNFAHISAEGKKYLILGEMLELGTDSSRLHEELGHLAGEADADFVWFIGAHQDDFARGVRSTSFSKNLLLSDGYKEDVATQVGSMLKGLDIVAIKGSRGMKLEQVLRVWNPVDF